jgi:hypothetical protein
MPGNPIEPPAWVRIFRPEDWAEPDEMERDMAAGSGFGDEHREWHARRRWCESRNRWLVAHPEVDALALLLGG